MKPTKVVAVVMSVKRINLDCQYECVVKEEKNGMEHTVRFPDHMYLQPGDKVVVKV